MKLKTQLDRIRKARPKHSEYGQMYRNKQSLSGAWKDVVLHTLFISEDNTHLIRSHQFHQSYPMSAKEWHAWFSKHLGIIHRKSILPGMHLRTGKAWSVQRILGWHPHVGSKHCRSTVVRKRYKTQHKRLEDG